MAPDEASEAKPECSASCADILELKELVSKLDSLPASVEPKSSDGFRDTANASCLAQDCTSGGGSKGSLRMSAGSCGTTGSLAGVPDGGATHIMGKLCIDALPSSSNLLR